MDDVSAGLGIYDNIADDVGAGIFGLAVNDSPGMMSGDGPNSSESEAEAEWQDF